MNLNESPYIVAMKYAFSIVAGGAVAAAIVSGTVKAFRRGLKFIRPETQVEAAPAVEPIKDSAETV